MSSTSRSPRDPQQPAQGRPASSTDRREKVAAMRAHEAALAKGRRAVIISAVVVGALLLVGVIGYAVQSSRDDTGEVAVPATATGTDNGIVVGNPAAPVTIDFYEDFQCPVCKRFETTLGKTITGMIDSGKEKVVYHMMSVLGPESTRAANAAAAAAHEGKFREYHDILYANQPPERSDGYQNNTLLALGKQIGLTSPAFVDAVNNGTYNGYVAKVTDDASKRGVNGTPTVFVNGRQLDAAQMTSMGLTLAVSAAAVAASSPTLVK